jgi:hypothetical protein
MYHRESIVMGFRDLAEARNMTNVNKMNLRTTGEGGINSFDEIPVNPSVSSSLIVGRSNLV